LSKQTAQRILHRRLAGLDEALKASADFAAEHGLGSAWQHMVGLWLRLALAVRDADGHDLLPQEALDDLPRMGRRSAISCNGRTCSGLGRRAFRRPGSHR
jgi:hypothetical protein